MTSISDGRAVRPMTDSGPSGAARYAAILTIGILAAILLLLGLVALDMLSDTSARISIQLLAVVGASVAAGVALVGLRSGTGSRREGAVAEALDQLQAAYVVATAKGEIVFANQAAQELSGTDQSPLSFLRRYADGDEQREALVRLEGEALTRPGRALLRVRRSPEEVQSFELAVMPLPGRPHRVLWRIEDVTEREQQRAKLESEHARVMEVFDEAPIGLYSIDKSGRFLVVNDTLAEWLGSSTEALMRDGSRLRDFLLPSPQPTSRPPFDPYAPAEGLEVILHGRQGKVLKASISQSVVRGEGELRTRSVVRDLSSERTWEDALRLVRQRFQRFFEIAPVGIALLEGEGRFTEANRALEQLLTDGQQKLTGRDLFEFVEDDAKSEVQARLAAAWAGEPAAGPLEIRLKGPREKNAALFVSRLESEDGGLSGLILHFIDLTEQKSLEAQFAQSQKMQAVGQLAGGVAHDFNNLLTAMIGFCDLLLLRFRPGDQSFADIMQIKQNANRAANLVRQLLAFSRQQPLQPRVIAVGDVLSELSHLLNRLLGDNIELKMVHGRNVGPVKVDQGQFEQVIINLAVNARDAMPNGGTLTIRTSMFESNEPVRRKIERLPPPGTYVQIDVSDTGTGIPREIIDRIFEPFFSTKEVGTGTGLGLSTVYGIVKQTGGFIFVDSTVGQGTRFSIYLPVYAASAAELARPAAADGGPSPVPDLTGAGTVLLVEDEDPVRLFSARALRNKGYNVLEARSGEAALKIIADAAEPIDLVVTDVQMPRMDGPTLIRHVRETLPDVKVIYISGYTEDTFRKRLDDGEDIHFLPKPFTLKDLAGKVKEIMAGPPG